MSEACGFSAAGVATFRMHPWLAPPSIRKMSEATTYAIVWDDDENRFVGSLRLEPDLMRFEGRGSGGEEGLRTVTYGDIRRIELRRNNGSREIAISLADNDNLLLTSLDAPGSLGELADRLRRSTDYPHS